MNEGNEREGVENGGKERRDGGIDENSGVDEREKARKRKARSEIGKGRGKKRNRKERAK